VLGLGFAGAVRMVVKAGEPGRGAGECAAYDAGEDDGHQVSKRTDSEARFRVIGSKAAREVAHYPDHGLKVTTDADGPAFTYEDGRPYTGET